MKKKQLTPEQQFSDLEEHIALQVAQWEEEEAQEAQHSHGPWENFTNPLEFE
jgi:hypothetical protein